MLGKTAMVPPKPAYDTDWIFSNNSNVHIANHRDWFTSYTPFATTVNSGLGAAFDTAGGIRVEGIGDVELPVKIHPTKTGHLYHRTILLRGVLYAPSATCNILGGPIMKEHKVILDSNSGSKITSKATGACVGLLDMNKLIRLRLRGQSAKQSSLDPNGMYIIRARWDDSERLKWTAYQQSTAKGGPMSDPNNSPPLTQAEKQWLKDNYGDEFDFLRQHGLSIYKDEQREEGRRILRVLKDIDTADSTDDGDDGSTPTDSDEDSDDDDESTNSFLRDLESDPTSHVADRFFTDKELDWIAANYRHSGNFLLSHGLKPFDDDDCEEGKSIVRALMSDD
ncbi:MAG: hypothetical protein Q9166_000664 [cf. Caloplaca sp. 2 TL-2023]